MKLRDLILTLLLGGTAFAADAYQPAQYDLSALPAYAPTQRVTGVLRIYGTPLEALVGKWANAFRGYHGQVRLNAYLINTSQAFAGLVTGSADIGLMGHRQWRNGFQAFQAQFGYAPLEIRFAGHADDLLERLAAENRASEAVCIVSSDALIRRTSGQEVRKQTSRAFLADLPIVLTLVAFAPIVPLLGILVMEAVGLSEFGRDYRMRVRVRDYLRLLVGFLPYHLLLAGAACHAASRELRGVNNWEKTTHVGAHL